MALDLTQLKKNYQEPTDEVSQRDRRGFSKMEKQIAALFAQLGINTGEKGFEKTASGAPRFFEIGEDGTIKNALGQDNDVKSEAFLEKIAKGNVFTFPVGQKKPVQISTDGQANIGFSKPLDNVMTVKEPEKPTEPKKPTLSGWKSFLNKITFGSAYKKDVAAYKANMGQYSKDMTRYEQDMEQYREDKAVYDKQAAFQKGVDNIQNSRSEADISAEVEHERKWEEKQFAIARDKEHYVSKLDAQINSMSNYYKPKPDQNKEITGTVNGKSYTQEQFDKLKTISIEGIKIGGKQLTDDQFASLAMCAALMPQHGGRVRLDDYSEGAVTLEESAIVHATFFTSDLGMKGENGVYRPRENAGTYFETAVEPGREYAVEALAAYQAGHPEKLGQLIAYGIKFEANNVARTAMNETASLMTDVMIGRSAELLTNDMNLLMEAKKAGLTSKEINGMKGAQVLADVYRENERAQKLMDLENSTHYTKGLSDQERADCVKSRLRYEAANESLKQHIEQKDKDPEFLKRQKKLHEEMSKMDLPNASAKNPGETDEAFYKRVAEAQEKASKMIQDATAKESVMMQQRHGVPDVFIAAGSGGVGIIDKLSEKLLPGQDKLMNLKGKELDNALKDPALFSGKSPYAQKETQKTEPTVQKEVTKVKTTDRLEV